MLIRNNICIEVIEEINSDEHIIKDTDGNALYVSNTGFEQLTLSEVSTHLNYLKDKKTKWRSEERRQYQIYKFSQILDIMRKYSRMKSIDNLLGDNERNLTGLNPLVFAC